MNNVKANNSKSINDKNKKNNIKNKTKHTKNESSKGSKKKKSASPKSKKKQTKKTNKTINGSKKTDSPKKDETEKKDNTDKENSEDALKENENKLLRAQINEKMQQIQELSLSQENNKRILTELLKKLNSAITTNAELLYSEIESDLENKLDKKKRMDALRLMIEMKKKELESSKELNKNYKKRYETLFKENNISSLDKIDCFQRQIDDMKTSNCMLNKRIRIFNYKNHLEGKRLDLNAKNKMSYDIKKYSDEYTTLVKEKYNQFVKLNKNKKLIKDAVEQFQYLIKMLSEDNNNNKENEKNNENNFLERIKTLKIEEDINNIKEDLSGNEENIYNKIINDKSIILEKYNLKNKTKSLSLMNKNSKSIKKMKLSIDSNPKNKNNINSIKYKKLMNSKSCNAIIINRNDKIKSSYSIENLANVDVNDEININYNDINYDSLTNIEYEKMNEKKKKYINLDEKLDKSIKDLSLLYEHKIKDINSLLDVNTKNLSNIQQENELLKSKIADLRRLLELNKKEQKLISQNIRYKNNNFNDQKLNIVNNNEKDINEIEEIKEEEEEKEDKEKFQMSDIGKNITYEKKDNKALYIDMLKEKYNVKTKVKTEDIITNQNDFDKDL